MIRFIDIRDQGTGSRFAFWNTSSSSFLTFSGSQAWDSFKEFQEDFDEDPTTDDIDRFRRLCPDWVNDGNEDDIEHFYDTKV